MNGVVIEFRERAKGNVTTPMILWSIVMAVVIFLVESSVGPHHTAVLVGVVATALLGIYLGWRRRTAAVFVAPFVSWLFAWVPLWVAAMVHHGFLKGLFWGLFLVTFGWVVIGFAEFLWLGAVTLIVRMLRGSGRHGEPDVVIFGPK